MRNRLKRLKIKHQLAIAGCIVAMPIVALVGRDIVNHAERIDAARTEIDGLRNLTPHRALMRAVPRHRALVQMRLGGADSVDVQIETVAQRIDALIAETRGDGVAAASTSQGAMDLGRRWNILRDAWRDQSAIQAAGAHAQLMEAVVADMAAAAQRTGLLPSRSAESYRLAQLVVRTVPAAIQSLDEARALGQAYGGRSSSPAGNDAILVRRLLVLDLAATRIGDVLSTVEPSADTDRLNADLARLAAIEMSLVESRGRGTSEQRLVSLGEDAVETANAIHDAISNTLAQQLSDRVTALETARNIEVAALLLALGLIGLLLAIIGRNITQPIGRVVDICRQLGAGRYDQPLTRDVGGDMAVVIGALGDLQEELAREKRTRQQAEEEREGLRDQFVQSQKMEALGTLASGIAHDFNNVIAAIIGQAELAVFASQSGKPVEDRLERVVKAGLRAKTVVQQILSFARQETAVESEPVRPSQLLRETVDLVETGLQEPVSIAMDIDDDVGLIRINPSQCHQLLLNVLVNAGHAVGDTGASVACGVRAVEGAAAAGGASTAAPGDEAPPRYTLWSGELGNGDYANFWIADGGTGMDRETLARIFDPFFTTRTDGKGSGLGLSAAQGIVHNAGGAIHVGTTPGIGTRFDIFLPLSMETLTVEPANETAPIMPVGDARILLVDDNDDALDAAATALRAHGFSVDAHTDGAAALAAFGAAASEYDIVVTDHNMPGMTGLELAAKIHARRPDLPAILTTGRIDETLRSRARAAGIGAFVEKPFQAEVLASAVLRALADAGGGARRAT